MLQFAATDTAAHVGPRSLPPRRGGGGPSHLAWPVAQYTNSPGAVEIRILAPTDLGASDADLVGGPRQSEIIPWRTRTFGTRTGCGPAGGEICGSAGVV